MTCHDPHHDNDRTPAHHNARCLAPLGPDFAGETTVGVVEATTRTNGRTSTCPVNPADGCIGCHMPSVPIAPLHATFTDHYVRVHTDRRPGTSR